MSRLSANQKVERIIALDPERWNALLASRRGKEEWITPTMAAHWHSRYAANLDTHRHFKDDWADWRLMSGEPLHDVDLSNRDLDGVDFSGAHLTHVKMLKTGLRGANFSNARLNHVNLSGSLILGAEFRDAVLDDVDFSGAYLYCCNFRDCQLGNVRFDGARGCRITMLSLRSYDPTQHGG